MAAFDENKASKEMDLYSRQIGAFGVETMKNLVTLDILMVGLKGVGAEAAKDIILAGPRSVTLFDRSPITLTDLSSNCFFTEQHVGKHSAEVCVAPLAVLNPYVKVSEHTADLTQDLINKMGVVVCADNSLGLSDLSRLNAMCRTAGATFILGLATGITGTVFCDFGAKHKITDADGEPVRVNVIEAMELDAANSRIISTVADDNHELSDGQFVTFSDAEGTGPVAELNTMGPLEVQRIYLSYDSGKRQKLVPNRFAAKLSAEQLAKLTGMSYTGGAVATETKMPSFVEFKPFSEAIQTPGTVLNPDANKNLMLNRGAQLHFARAAVLSFIDVHKALPRLHNVEDAQECVAIARKMLEANKALGGEAIVVDSIDEPVVVAASLFARSELVGLATFIGGIIAQEIVKKFGKFTPIRQFLHLDYLEILPAEGNPVRADAAPIGSRYDPQISVIGRAAHEKLISQKWFMVGCGALGCEYLKGFALMGLSTGAEGLLHVTDMDRIEVSNLSRQFLFRKENVGQQKSACAATAATKMNPSMKIRCYETKVSQETEDIFGDAFWGSLAGACNALDNVIARRYVDSRCVFYEKPLLESGTLGTKANSEIIIPHKTMSYSEQKDPDLKNALPLCTMRNFPFLIEHCIEWSRGQFTDLFESPVQDALLFMKNKGEFIESLLREGNVQAQTDKLMGVKTVLSSVASLGRTSANPFASCMQLAASEFQKQHHSRIRDLTYSFPRDAKGKDPNTGAEIPFWSGTKRFPLHADLDVANPMHIDYLFATANMYAFMFGVPQIHDKAEFAKLLGATHLNLSQWKEPQTGVKIEEEDKDKKPDTPSPAPGAHKDPVIDQLLSELDALASQSAGRVLKAADFEKDDDTNFHIDFITACANMRAWNYHIKEASRHQCKMIAGKIIPAIATTTAMITGSVCMELYKMALGLPKDKFCSANVNLATSTFEYFEPENPKHTKPFYDVTELANVVPVPDGFTTWDKVVIDLGDLTVQQFLDAFPVAHHGCTVTFLNKYNLSVAEIKAGKDKPIFTSYCHAKSLSDLVEANKTRPLHVVYEELYGPVELGRKYLMLEGSFETPSGDVAKVPPIKYIFAH